MSCVMLYLILNRPAIGWAPASDQKNKQNISVKSSEIGVYSCASDTWRLIWIPIELQV